MILTKATRIAVGIMEEMGLGGHAALRELAVTLEDEDKVGEDGAVAEAKVVTAMPLVHLHLLILAVATLPLAHERR